MVSPWPGARRSLRATGSAARCGRALTAAPEVSSMRRRLLPAGLAFLVFTGLILVLPVFSPSRPAPVPVKTAAQEVPMGSVATPAPSAKVRSGTSQDVPGVPAAAPTLTVTRTHVKSFSMVGITWAFDAAVSDTVVRLRVQNDSGAW